MNMERKMNELQTCVIQLRTIISLRQPRTYSWMFLHTLDKKHRYQCAHLSFGNRESTCVSVCGQGAAVLLNSFTVVCYIGGGS